jgi:transcriptional regulator with PAS, ATPase and Fis domain
MITADEDSSTLKEIAAARGSRARRPIFLVGSYVPGSARVVGVDRPITVGRGRPSDSGVPGADANVILHSDRTLSRAHLRIARGDGGWQVDDLDSSNGTYVDGRRVKQQTPLSDGNIVQFGSHAGVFRRVSDEALAAIEQELAAPFGPVPTLSPALAVMLAGLRRLAGVRTHFLFLGETGVGKEVYARALHAASKRSGQFVAVNCAAIPSGLAESELFGFVRGAHSTATAAKQGLVELADKGTLLLDEIGDMPPELQVKLFRFLQDGKVTPLGSTRARDVDVRVIAATSHPSEAVRSDLIGRLGAEPIVIPPLRDRPEDIGALAARFGGEALASFGGMEPAAFRALCTYDWPRNVRELEEVIRRAITLAGGGREIRLRDLPAHVQASLERGPRVGEARPYRAAPTRLTLDRLLREHRGNVAAVAKALDRRWNVVQRWLSKHGLDAGRYRQ